MTDDVMQERPRERPPVTMTIDRDVLERLKAYAANVRTPYEVGVPFSRVAEVAITEYLDRMEGKAAPGH